MCCLRNEEYKMLNTKRARLQILTFGTTSNNSAHS